MHGSRNPTASWERRKTDRPFITLRGYGMQHRCAACVGSDAHRSTAPSRGTDVVGPLPSRRAREGMRRLWRPSAGWARRRHDLVRLCLRCLGTRVDQYPRSCSPRWYAHRRRLAFSRPHSQGGMPCFFMQQASSDERFDPSLQQAGLTIAARLVRSGCGRFMVAQRGDERVVLNSIDVTASSGTSSSTRAVMGMECEVSLTNSRASFGGSAGVRVHLGDERQGSPCDRASGGDRDDVGRGHGVA